MKVDWKVLDELLIGEAETDDISLQCKQELDEFLHTHNMNVFSEESLKELAGIFALSLGPAYEAQTKQKLPNIFHHIGLEPTEEESIDG